MGNEGVPPVIYMSLCPNCGSNISSLRLMSGLACERCLPEDVRVNGLEELVRSLKERGTLKHLSSVERLLAEFKAVSDIFRTAVGSEPMGPQRSWIVRALRGESFAIIAPPGLGKTTFGIIMSLYFSSISKKSLMIFPTKTLVGQVVQKIQEMSKNMERPPLLSYYLSGMNQSKRDEMDKTLSSGDFDIFVSTSRYVIDHIDELSRLEYNYLFVDDVDAVLKSGKSSVTILKLMGFSPQDIDRTKELLKSAREGDTSVFDEIKKIRENSLKDRVAIFSSATITRSNPVFTSLMGFRPGSTLIYLRNVVDSYLISKDTFTPSVELVKRLGPGGLVFVPVDKGTQYAQELASELNKWMKASAITSSNSRKLEEFESGQIDVLVGVATHYGLLVRGIDIPWRVRYAIFAGIPKFRFRLGEVMHPLAMLRVLTLLSLVLKDQEVSRVLRIVRARLRRTSPAALVMLAKSIREGTISDQYFIKAYEIVNKYLQDISILNKIAQLGDLSISDGTISIPDYLTYVQASGRTSRLYGSRLTTGLSIVIVDDETLFEQLKKKLSLVLDEIRWHPLDLVQWRIGETSVDDLMRKINEEREEITERKRSIVSPPLGKIKTTLFIVESPNKAKTISSFFSRPSTRDFDGLRVYETVIGDKILMVTASGGHIYDLTTKDIGIFGVEVRTDGGVEAIPFYNTIKRCDKGHQFTEYGEGNTCPICSSPKIRDKVTTIDALRRLVMEADEVLIGTDPDVEGEKIAWDLFFSLRPFNSNIYRAEFHEVTRKAIMESLNSPRRFSVSMLQSQIVRRIEDRWIGFKLSKKLQSEFWKEYCQNVLKENSCGENRNLSAGRVQTPVLGWIISRYQDYLRTKRTVYVARLLDKFTVLLPKQEGVRKNVKINVVITSIQKKEDTLGPFPAYTTDTFLSDASSFFSVSAPEAMRIAQDLFEMGLITYHRTDSIRISSTGIGVAESYLRNLLGERYKTIFKPRSWGEGGAHEAIRPTKPLDVEQLRAMIEEGELELPRKLTFNHYRLYDMIFRRFISSQVVPLIVEVEVLSLKAKRGDKELTLETPQLENVIKVRLSEPVDVPMEKLYIPFRGTMDSISKNSRDALPIEVEATVIGSFMKSDVTLYTEGDLISEMKNKRIGRPSTYAFIISTILKRGYVFETSRVKRLIPSKLGTHVYEFLNSKYSNFVSEQRTRYLLERMDLIEENKEDYRQVLKQLYDEIQYIR